MLSFLNKNNKLNLLNNNDDEEKGNKCNNGNASNEGNGCSNKEWEGKEMKYDREAPFMD